MAQQLAPPVGETLSVSSSPISQPSETLFLPREQCWSKEAHQPHASGTARILLVEDGLIVAEDTKRRLQSLGYQVVGTAPSGELAIELARGLTPDIVLMDIRLRGIMDGIEAAEIIRRTMHIPIIFTTAYSDDGTLERAKIAHPSGYVLKPCESRELRMAIELGLHMHLDCESEAVQLDNAVMLEAGPDGVFLVDAEGAFRSGNPRMAQMFGDRTMAILRKQGFIACVASAERDRARAFLASAGRGASPEPEAFTINGDGSGGHRFALSVAATSGRTPTAYVISARALPDAQQQRRGEAVDAFQRVQGALGVVSGLIGLHSRFLEDPASIRIMQENQNRVRALSLLYRHLTSSEAGWSLDLEGYVRDLISLFVRSNGVPKETFKIAPIRTVRVIGLERAVPTCLVLHELLSCALRQSASPSDTIEVSLYPNGNGTLHIDVRSSGKKNAEPAEGGDDFSTELAEYLVDQIQGTFSQPGRGDWRMEIPL